jgi:DNA polymerase-3 subunit alpha
MEKEIAGMFFSGNILDSYGKHVKELKPVRIIDVLGNQDDIVGYRDKQSAKLVGIITQRTIKKTKNEDHMAFVRLEDESGEIELIVFPKQYLRCSDILNVGNVIFVSGTTSIKDEEPCKLIVDKAQIMLSNEEYDKQEKKQKLYLKVDSVKSKLVYDIIELLKGFSGDTEIIFYDATEKKYVRPANLTISVDENVVFALKSILGEENVVLK